MKRIETVHRLRQWLLAPILMLAALVLSGCQTLSYYGQAIQGHYQIVAHQDRIERLLADPETPARLRSKLQLVQEMRAFAARDLKLPVDGHYEKYADVQRRFVVWNVEAAPELSLEAKTWWYPFVGRLEYQGYFSEVGAKRYAARLRKKGYDVCVGGVEAYSTLGWFRDPVLNTFIFNDEPDLAETIFHELAHQRVFASGDTDFNEAFATTVGQEGARRWLRAKGDQAGIERYEIQVRRTRQFARLVADTRERLQALYGDVRTAQGNRKTTGKATTTTPDQLRRQKRQLLELLQQEYQNLKTEQWGGDTEYDDWFAGELNNAKLNSVAAYYGLVPAFERLLTHEGGDWERFYHAVRKLARHPKSKRHTLLTNLGNAGASRRVSALED